MKRVLIVGASSFIGSNLARSLRQPYRLITTYRTHSVAVDDVVTFRFPIDGKANISEFMRALKPDVTIYSAGWGTEKQCTENMGQALFLHAEAAATFASAATPWDGKFIYFSTSKVFSGEEGAYAEADPTSAKTAYGLVKVQAEDAVLRYPNTYVLRLGAAYGMGARHHGPWMMNLLKALWKKKHVPIINDEWRTFLSLDDLALAISAIIEAPLETAGIYHVGHSERHTYFTFAEAVAAAFSISKEYLQGLTGAVYSELTGSQEVRGADRTMNCQHFTDTFKVSFTGAEESLKELRRRLDAGRQ